MRCVGRPLAPCDAPRRAPRSGDQGRLHGWHGAPLGRPSRVWLPDYRRMPRHTPCMRVRDACAVGPDTPPSAALPPGGRRRGRAQWPRACSGPWSIRDCRTGARRSLGGSALHTGLDCQPPGHSRAPYTASLGGMGGTSSAHRSVSHVRVDGPSFRSPQSRDASCERPWRAACSRHCRTSDAWSVTRTDRRDVPRAGIQAAAGQSRAGSADGS